jgi:hypothetical protein
MMMISHQMKGDTMCGACSTHGAENREMHIAFYRKSEGKKPLGRPRRRWKDNVEMVLKEI